MIWIILMVAILTTTVICMLRQSRLLVKYLGYSIIVCVVLFIIGGLSSDFYPDRYIIKSEIPLTTLYDGAYVSVNSDGMYTYRHEIYSDDTSNSDKLYATDTVSGDVIEMESPDCTTPTLYIRECEGKWTFWSIGCIKHLQYVFHIPHASIINES